ncbi:MAG: phenylacetaldoxime dehydratase family protein [Gammaproteobacteria bacterium]|nr:phenylacetaldoxime dehydratase family protein [Gammaproteobacteria bacterium]MDE0283224.1 phenylacetaldoxime dehydratase family protein [Gammaproteobacteria bacterium]
MPQNNMPKDWEPPYPSWSAQFKPQVRTVVVGYFAVQHRDGNVAGFKRWMQSLLSIDNAPLHHEQARYTDEAGHTNHVYICYWTEQERYNRWAAAPQVMEWWDDPARQEGVAGYWREVIFAPIERLETLFSSEDGAGMAKLAIGFGNPIREHGYWGGMRDRMTASEHNDFSSKIGDRLVSLPSVECKRKRVRITPPENICLIRSAQNWMQCQGSELDLYLNDVHPVLLEGMNFIRDNPLETGCISCRFMDELNGSGEKQSKTFGMAYFLTMAHLESWVRSHPTHLAIFRSFHQMVQQLNFQLDLKLWHEVIVLPEGPHVFEYLNCHERTGLLPYFSSGDGLN